MLAMIDEGSGRAYLYRNECRMKILEIQGNSTTPDNIHPPGDWAALEYLTDLIIYSVAAPPRSKGKRQDSSIKNEQVLTWRDHTCEVLADFVSATCK